MAKLQTYEVNTPDVSRRFRILSKTISDYFRTPYEARPLAASSRSAKLHWACADGVDYSLAEMPALRLTNLSTGSIRAPRFHVFSSDHSYLIKIPGRNNLHMQPGQLLIMASDMPCELIIPRDYKTTAFIIDGDVFRDAIPDALTYLGRPLRLNCSLEALLRSTMDAGWHLSRAGLFESAGPKLVRALLHIVSALPLSADEELESRGGDALDVRRQQAKSFIENNFTSPTVTVASIAENLCVSQRYLQLAFRGEGIAPLEYLRKYRLDAAARLLRDSRASHRTITDICFSCGFNSCAHFSTQFRRMFGVCPREYRMTRKLDADRRDLVS